MVSRRQIITLAVAYTVLMAIAVSFADISGTVVIAVAWVWFNIGRRVGHAGPATPIKWGRQP